MLTQYSSSEGAGTNKHELFGQSLPLLRNVDKNRKEVLRSFTRKDKLTPLHIWGAAGKGVVLASALSDCFANSEIRLIDSDSAKQGRYAPVSGCAVIAPLSKEEFKKYLPNLILSNPRFEEEIFSYYSA